MKNILRKKILLFIIILFIFETNAAIVSDNDGSAFVTKAEFESLKGNFAGQIKNYETSIDKKVDGAIASYLAGVNLSKKEVLPVIYNKWDVVTCMDYALKNAMQLLIQHGTLFVYGICIIGLYIQDHQAQNKKGYCVMQELKVAHTLQTFFGKEWHLIIGKK